MFRIKGVEKIETHTYFSENRVDYELMRKITTQPDRP
jgi:hypothetical protein